VPAGGPTGIRAVLVWSKPAIDVLSFNDDVLAVALPHPPRGSGYDPESFIRDSVGEVLLGGPSQPARQPRVILVFGHLTVPGIERGSEVLDMPRGREVRYPIEAIRERWGDRAVMLNGHYHRSYRRAQGPVVVPGSLERLTKSEARNEPGCLILEV
jgi:hypothetical protein